MSFIFIYPNGDEVYNVICVYLAAGISGYLAMNDGESLDLKYFSIDDLPYQLDEKARLIIERYFI
ncbi:Uncharacterised protein [Mycobacteroides abscessus subsp. abscessus]|nr:Uncharacterised protein [Mycobacteroides abscessus subsp. abscessus]